MIKRLDQNLSEYIKSQQYIHNTYTIVKELVENSLDANSKIIKVYFDDKLISVDDNGDGIVDIKNTGREHYTSKDLTSYSLLGLNSNNDLQNGYRGIALSAIKNLCDIEITSKYKSDKIAYKKVFVNRQEDAEPEKAIRESGTFVKVFNLFRDCKIRRVQNERALTKHVKKTAELLESYACVYDVHFVLTFKKKQILSIKGCGHLKNYIFQTYKDHLEASLTRDNRSYYFFMLPFTEKKSVQKIFLNKRVVRSTKILRLIKDTYNMFNEGTPTFFIDFKDSADFNISPDKSEFIIRNEEELIRSIREDITRFFRDQVYLEGKNNTVVIEEEVNSKETPFVSQDTIIEDKTEISNDLNNVITPFT
ncbi:Mismatch repair endonuclease PMS2, partial [Nosema granulosis]